VADFFFDTSALVKRFSRETGTAWVIDLVRPASGHVIYLANITSVEPLTRMIEAGILPLEVMKISGHTAVQQAADRLAAFNTKAFNELHAQESQSRMVN